MSKPRLSFLKVSLCVPWAVCALWVACGAALAEKADKNKPIHIESDALRFDDREQVSVFTGNVVLTKGTIVIRGAEIIVREDPQGNQFGVAKAAPGKLAYFRQKREGVDEFIEGEGEVIEYNGEQDWVRFSRQAIMRRLRGAQLADEAIGAVIQYDNTTDVFTVDGGAPQGKAQPGGRGRVRVMLTPKPDTKASSAVTTAATPAAGSAPTSSPVATPARPASTPLVVTPALKDRP
jgi:lipopolysaccharide export system protein LptA